MSRSVAERGLAATKVERAIPGLPPLEANVVFWNSMLIGPESRKTKGPGLLWGCVEECLGLRADVGTQQHQTQPAQASKAQELD
jgi:hypothetical protein